MTCMERPVFSSFWAFLASYVHFKGRSFRAWSNSASDGTMLMGDWCDPLASGVCSPQVSGPMGKK